MLTLPPEGSYWRKSYADSLYPALKEDKTADVVIIGAGITGLTTAYLLKQSGLKVIVLDKDTIGGGTSGRTTGKITSQHNLVYADLVARLGEETARLYGEANEAAVAKVRSIIRRHKIDCEFHSEDNYVFTTDPRQAATYRNEAKVAAGLGLPATFETSVPLPFRVSGAVRFADQGRMNAQRYLLGLAKAVHDGGSSVHEYSNAGIIRDGRPGHVRANGVTVTAEHIVVATNVPTMPLAARGAYCLLEYPEESYIVAGPTTKRLDGMYISSDEDNYSILPFEIDGVPSVLVGGEGRVSARQLGRRRCYRRLADYAERKLGVTAITYRWSDRDYLAYDGLPLIGRLYHWSHNLYVGTAFKKWGLSNGTVAGVILHDLITGMPNSWAAVFDATRLRPVSSIPRVAFQKLRATLS